MWVALSVVVLSMVAIFFWTSKQWHVRALAQKFPGPADLPLIGNAHQLGTNTMNFFEAVQRLCKEYIGKTFRLWIGNTLFLVITTPKDVEIVLGSNKLIDKAVNYEYLHPWLGTGLLTSTGAKWRRHRKILTPTFHFKILEEFVEVFQINGKLLVEALSVHAGGPTFDIHEYITLCALDNICETAMGVKINALHDRESEYIKAIREQSSITMQRSFKPWLGPDILFNMTSLKSRHDKSLKKLHDVTNGVIKARRAEMNMEQKENGTVNGTLNKSSDDGIKRRLAFLDLLIESTLNGSGLTDENIREEVDTFMFEGHDTTAAAISFSLWLLSWNQDIQALAVKELEEVWPDITEPLPFRSLQELKYLERVIKEALRLYPSVPIYARMLMEDTVLSDGMVAPKGASLAIVAFMTHRDPRIFPEPERFDPERFLPENIQGRHPYAYIPFSAGPRNCIGQKFATLEMKCTLAQILRSFKILPGPTKPNLALASELILTSKTGTQVKIEKRQ